MAIGDPYVTLAQMKNYFDIPTNKVSMDERLTDAIDSASREIEQYCGRQFNQDAAPSPRIYEPDSWNRIEVDDFYTTTGLVVASDYAGDQSYATIYTAADYELYPLSGVVDGIPGWPYHRIRLSRNTFPFYDFGYGNTYGRGFGRRQGTVQVTAAWGWAAVPSTIKQACKLIAAQTFKMADAPLGVAGMDVVRGTTFSGPYGVARVQDLPQVAAKLDRFKSMRIMVG